MWKNVLLTRVETSTPKTFATSFGFKFRRLIKPALRPILRLASGRRIHVESYPKLEKGAPYIFVSTHSFVDDIITNYAVVDRSAYTLIGTPDQVEHNPLLYAAWLCGMVFVNKVDPQNRKDAVEKMVRVLENNTSVIVYAEGAWNNTENLLVQPLFASISTAHRMQGRAGEPIDLVGMEKREALDKLRDAMATLTWELMTDHATVLKRADLRPEPRLGYIDERMREYLCTKWTRDDWALEVTIYRDKTLPPTPEEVRASFDNVKLTPQNAGILAPILARREEDKKYDLVKYMQERWNK